MEWSNANANGENSGGASQQPPLSQTQSLSQSQYAPSQNTVVYQQTQPLPTDTGYVMSGGSGTGAGTVYTSNMNAGSYSGGGGVNVSSGYSTVPTYSSHSSSSSSSIFPQTPYSVVGYGNNSSGTNTGYTHSNTVSGTGTGTGYVGGYSTSNTINSQYMNTGYTQPLNTQSNTQSQYYSQNTYSTVSGTGQQSSVYSSYHNPGNTNTSSTISSSNSAYSYQPTPYNTTSSTTTSNTGIGTGMGTSTTSNTTSSVQSIYMVPQSQSQSMSRTNTHTGSTSGGYLSGSATGLNNPHTYSNYTHNTHNTTSTSNTQPSTTPAPAPAPAPVATPQPTLNWQVCEAVFHAAIGKDSKDPKDTKDAPLTQFLAEGRIAMGPDSMGCLMKTKDLSLVFTEPALSAVREELCWAHHHAQTTAQGLSKGLLADQRLMRRAYCKELLRRFKETARTDPAHILNLQGGLTNAQTSNAATVIAGPANFFLSLSNRAQKTRTRKIGYREARFWEREERVARESKKKDKKARMTEFFKKLVSHQEAFTKFHKDARTEMSKLCKSLRATHETAQNRLKREEMKLELQRLQALRSGEMQSYVQLVAHTKNDRLQFLIDQTDKYLASINQLIQDQRVAETEKEKEREKDNEREGESASTSAVPSEVTSAIERERVREEEVASEKLTKASKDYYRSTHRLTESVQQPAMFKGGQLKDYQLVALQWLVSLYNNHLNGILADEMGLGKTVQTIALLAYIVEVKRKHGPFLVVVPLSTLSNWVNEFSRWCPDLCVIEYTGPKNVRKDIRKHQLLNKVRPFNVLLTTYEYVIRDKSHLRKFPWEYIVVDEGHRMKNSEGLLSRILGSDYHSRNRLLLTGTPLQNNLPELWSLLNFLLPTIFSSAETFDEWFNKPFTQFKQQDQANGANGGADQANRLTQEEQLLIVQRLHEVLRPFVLRRLKSQVLDQLPEKVEAVLRCPLSGWQRKMYRSVLSKGLGGNNGEKGGGAVANTLMQLRKVCNHPYLFLQSYVLDDCLIAISGKLQLLDRMLPKLKAAGHRVLIFSQMVETLKVLQEYMRYRGHHSLMLSGDVASEEREQSIAVFNAEDSPYFVFLLSTKAGGLGVNLATADTVIIFDSDWNPSGDDQAQGRAHRIGQRNKVSVFRLLTSGSVEEKVLSIAEGKRHLTGLVVEAGGFGGGTASATSDSSSAATNRELMELLLQELRAGGLTNTGTNKEGEREGDGGGEGEGEREDENDFDKEADSEVLEDDELNELLATYEGEFELYKAMDEQALGRTHSASSSLSPSLSLPLMKSTDLPYWMTTDCWLPKYAVLRDDMLCTDLQAREREREREKARDDEDAPGRLRRRESGKVYVDEFFFPEELEEMERERGRGRGRPRKSVVERVPERERERETVVQSESESSDSESEEERERERERPALTINPQTNTLTIRLSLSSSSKTTGSSSAVRKSISTTPAGPSLSLSVKKKSAVKRERDEGEGERETVVSAKKTPGGGTGAKRGRKSALSLLPPCTQALAQAVQAIEKLDIATLFRVKVCPKFYPTYYTIVPQPISLKEILLKLKAGEYRFFEQLELDFALMSHNARLFNTEQSFVFDYAEKLRRDFYRRARPVLRDFDVRPLSLSVIESEGERGPEGEVQQAMPPLPKDSHLIYSPSAAFTGALPQGLFSSTPPTSAAKKPRNEDY